MRQMWTYYQGEPSSEQTETCRLFPLSSLVVSRRILHTGTRSDLKDTGGVGVKAGWMDGRTRAFMSHLGNLR
ncbi:hypothetical protein Q5P01_021908 [Channa striata]|uniref:Uncharacterized protein n=1 Tax=Channa striata TaxID=64152 RepID=A0AA88LVL0_CHASR|nr:hypothetical protein Q5P01_021908 [Channa striata]